MTPLNEDMVHVSKWRNVPVKAELARHRFEPRAPGAPAGAETEKEIRARENRDCLGGMRSPWKAVRRMSWLRETGRLLRGTIEE